MPPSRERSAIIQRALRAPVEFCLSALKQLLREPLERFGHVMFERGVRYERDRIARASTQPLPPHEPFDPDKTPETPYQIPRMSKPPSDKT